MMLTCRRYSYQRRMHNQSQLGRFIRALAGYMGPALTMHGWMIGRQPCLPDPGKSPSETLATSSEGKNRPDGRTAARLARVLTKRWQAPLDVQIKTAATSFSQQLAAKVCNRSSA